MTKMNTLPTLPLNEIYRHYLDEYFHATNLSEPRLTRSELAQVLQLLPTQPENSSNAASWLGLLSPAWLRGEPESEPFPQNVVTNRLWREVQRMRKEEREAAVRQKNR